MDFFSTRKKIAKKFFILVMAIANITWANPSQNLLRKSKEEFRRGRYESALNYLKNLDVRAQLDNYEDMTKAFSIRAISYWQLKEIKKAKEAMRDLYLLDENFEFNAFDTGEEFFEISKEVKNEFVEKAKRLSQFKKPKPNPDIFLPKPEPLTIEKTIFVEKKLHYTTNLLPFGINHFLQGDKLFGSIYLSAQSLFLLGNIGSYWLKQSYVQDYGTPRLKNPQNLSRFNLAQNFQYISLGALLISYAASVIQSFLNFSKRPPQKSRGDEITSWNDRKNLF